MKTFKFIPEDCGENGRFEGHIEIKKLNFDQKYQLIEQIDLIQRPLKKTLKSEFL